MSVNNNLWWIIIHQERMGSENLSSISEVSELEEKGAQKISVSHQTNNGLDYTGEKPPHSFIVDIERFASHLTTTDKDTNANSRITVSLTFSLFNSTLACIFFTENTVVTRCKFFF